MHGPQWVTETVWVSQVDEPDQQRLARRLEKMKLCLSARLEWILQQRQQAELGDVKIVAEELELC